MRSGRSRGEQTTALGPFYDPAQDKMLGGIINTFSNTAFAETTFGLFAMQKRVGSVREMNRQSATNRAAVDEWLERHPLFEHGVTDKARRGAAVTLLRVKDPDITDPAVHASIVAKTKQLLGYEGLTHPDGTYEPGLDVARYVNAFPGTPGDFRAWIGGARPVSDIVALLDNIEYCYLRAKVVALEEQLAEDGTPVGAGRLRLGLRKACIGPRHSRSGQEDLRAPDRVLGCGELDARRKPSCRAAGATWRIDDPRSGAADSAHSRVGSQLNDGCARSIDPVPTLPGAQ